MNSLRLSALAVSGALTLSLLAACGGEKAPAASDAPQVSPTPAVTESALPSPGGSEAPSASESPAATETPAVSQKPSPTQTPAAVQTAPSTQKPAATQKPTPAPAAPSDGGGAQAMSVSDLWDKVSAGLELPSLMDLDDDMLSSLYGISAADLDGYVAKIPLMNVKSTEFFLAKVASGKMDAVKAGIARRQADLETQWKQYLPDQLALVEDYRLVTSGDYVFFVIAEGADSAVSAFNDCTK